MGFVILVYLNTLYTITSGLPKHSYDECRHISKENISRMCKNSDCVKDPSVASFCEHVYGRRFKCQSKYLPFKFICDGIIQCTDKSDEDPIVCSYIACEDNFYKCQGSNRCIHVSKICNGIDDCSGGYDDFPPVCRTKLVDCGVIANTKITPLIMNGSPITSTIWPWFAALFTPINDKWKFFCSSTIISRDTLLTAAHCVWNLSKKAVKVAAGKTFSDFYEPEPTSQISDVRNIFLHPLYQDSLGNYGSDIAIIKLRNPFNFSDSVLPICMNWTLRNIVRDMGSSFQGKVAGMGITENASVSNELRVTSVQIVKNEDCLQNQKFEFRKYVTIGSFCAKGVKEGVVCNGDSGSGLVIRSNVTGKWIIEGIVSISPKNPYLTLCDKNYHSIYTKVGMYTNWIYEHLY